MDDSTDEDLVAEVDSFTQSLQEDAERLLGIEEPFTLKCLAAVGEAYSQLGRIVLARRYLSESLFRYKKVSGSAETNAAIVDLTRKVAKLHLKSGNVIEAESKLLDAIRQHEELHGKTHPNTLEAISDLALLRFNQGRLEEAEGLHRRTLTERIALFGEMHPESLTSKAKLSMAIREQGFLDEAKELQLEVLEGREKILGNSHPDTLMSLFNLFRTLQIQERYLEADALENEWRKRSSVIVPGTLDLEPIHVHAAVTFQSSVPDRKLEIQSCLQTLLSLKRSIDTHLEKSTEFLSSDVRDLLASILEALSRCVEVLGATANALVVNKKYFQGDDYQELQTLFQQVLAAGQSLTIASREYWYLLLPPNERKFDAVLKRLTRGKGTSAENPIHLIPALQIATRKGYIVILKNLLELKADVNYNSPNKGPALHQAVRFRQLPSIRLLLDAGADLTFNEEHSGTALHVAVDNGFTDVVQLLLDTTNHQDIKRTINALKVNAETPLHLAAQEGHCEIGKLLLKSGADPKIRINGEWNALHLAACHAHVEFVKLLLDKRRDSFDDSDLLSSLDLAAQRGHGSVIEVLLDRLGPRKLLVKDIADAVAWARHNGHTAVVTRLFKAFRAQPISVS